MPNLDEFVLKAALFVPGTYVGQRRDLEDNIQEVIVLYRGYSHSIQLSLEDLKRQKEQVILDTIVIQLQKFKVSVEKIRIDWPSQTH